MTSTALLNGRREKGAWIRSRGLHYGDGVFRTALVWNGQVVDLDRQIAKLDADAGRIELRCDARSCRDEAATLGRGHRRAVIKLMLWRRAQQRGYRPATSAAERLLILDDLPALTRSSWTRGIRAFRSPVALSAQPRLAGLKHLGRAEQVLASARWPRGMTEAIQCDASGRPIGGTRSNLFWISGGRLYTPLLADCGISGLMREKVLELANRLGISWNIDRWRWRHFEESDEAFVTNSIVGIWPLRRCDNRAWRAPGPVTRTLTQHLSHPLGAS